MPAIHISPNRPTHLIGLSIITCMFLGPLQWFHLFCPKEVIRIVEQEIVWSATRYRQVYRWKGGSTGVPIHYCNRTNRQFQRDSRTFGATTPSTQKTDKPMKSAEIGKKDTPWAHHNQSLCFLLRISGNLSTASQEDNFSIITSDCPSWPHKMCPHPFKVEGLLHRPGWEP